MPNDRRAQIVQHIDPTFRALAPRITAAPRIARRLRWRLPSVFRRRLAQAEAIACAMVIVRVTLTVGFRGTGGCHASDGAKEAWDSS